MVEDTQKRYADDVTLQELVRLRVENERLQSILKILMKLAGKDMVDSALQIHNAMNGERG